MTAKLTAQAGTGGFRRTFVDRNRIAKITDRRFHAAWEELRASRLWITETVAGECVGNRRIGNLDTMRAEAARICRTEAPATMMARDAAQDIWWIDEWRSTNGIVGLKRLNEEQSRYRDRLLQRMIPEHFECAAQEEVEQLADARMVAEIAALGEELLLSSNFNRVEIEDLNQWLRAQPRSAGKPVQGPIHLVDGYVKECMEQSEAGRMLGLKAILGGFWPEDRDADEDEVMGAALGAAARMQKRGAHLNQAGAYLAEKLTDRRWKDWIVWTIGQMRASGGARTQAAERRHPKHRAWERKQYADNTPELARRLHEARLRWPEGQLRYTVSAENDRYSIGWLKAAGEVIEPVGTAPNAAVVAETLIICGLEPESRRKDTTDGLMRGRQLCLGE